MSFFFPLSEMPWVNLQFLSENTNFYGKYWVCVVIDDLCLSELEKQKRSTLAVYETLKI